MKYIIGLVFFVAVIVCVPQTASGMTYSNPNTGTTYTLRVDGSNAIITDCDIHEWDFTIPETVRGFSNTMLTITGIDNNAFKDCTSLRTLTIPDTVTSIGDYAFMSCNNLTTIDMPPRLDTLGKGVFNGCHSLQSVTIPDGISRIGEAMFSNCRSLTTISLTGGITTIERGAFSNCHALRQLNLPGSLTSIGAGAFTRCSALDNITIPQGITTIYESTFKDCTALTHITLPEGLTRVDDSAFHNCSSLNEITLPDSLRITGMFVFAHCESLESITIPGNMERLSDAMFDDCTSLTRISIPASVTRFGSSVFAGCTSLRSFAVPDTVRYMEGSTFVDCSSLVSVKLSAHVASISSYEFNNCSSLQNITIPANIIYLGDHAFDGCSSLNEASFLGNAPHEYDFGMHVFDNCAPDFKIKYIFGKSGWSNPFHGYPAECVIELNDDIPEIEPPADINLGALENKPDDLMRDVVSLRALPGVGFIRLEWSIACSSKKVIGYNIYKSTAPGAQAETPEVSQLNALSYIDPDVQNGTTYYYTVKPVFEDKSIGTASNEAAVSPHEAAGTLELSVNNPIMDSNGVKTEIDKGFGTVPFLKDGRTYLPIRALVEEMGGMIEWDGAQKKVTIIFNGIAVELFVGQTKALVNGVETTMEAMPFISATGRTMLPLRFVGESLGCHVAWDDPTKTAFVSYDTEEEKDTSGTDIKAAPSVLPVGVPGAMDAPVISNLVMLKDDNGLPYFRAELTVPESVIELDANRPAGGWVDLEIDGKIDDWGWGTTGGGGGHLEVFVDAEYAVPGKTNVFYVTFQMEDEGGMTETVINSRTYTYKARFAYTYYYGDDPGAFDYIYSPWSSEVSGRSESYYFSEG